MEDATRIAQASAGGTSVELDTAPRAVVATVPQASRAARKSAQALRIVATGDNLLSAAPPDLTPERRQQRRERLRAAFHATVDARWSGARNSSSSRGTSSPRLRRRIRIARSSPKS